MCCSVVCLLIRIVKLYCVQNEDLYQYSLVSDYQVHSISETLQHNCLCVCAAETIVEKYNPQYVHFTSTFRYLIARVIFCSNVLACYCGTNFHGGKSFLSDNQTQVACFHCSCEIISQRAAAFDVMMAKSVCTNNSLVPQ